MKVGNASRHLGQFKVRECFKLICLCSLVIQFSLFGITHGYIPKNVSNKLTKLNSFSNRMAALQLKNNKLLVDIVSRFNPTLASPSKSLLAPVTFKDDKVSLPLLTPNKEKSSTIKKATTLEALWLDNGGTNDEFNIIKSNLSSLKEVPVTYKAGTKIRVLKDTDDSILTISIRVKDDRVVKISREFGGDFSIQNITEQISEQERVVTGTIFSSFIEAAQNSGLPISMVDDFVDLFGDRIEFRKDLQPGDTFAIVFTQKRAPDGTWLSGGEIRAASLVNSGKLKAVIRYRSKSGQWQSYNESGNPIGAFFLRYPVQFSRISSVFTDARMHPVLGIVRPHNGVDFAAPIGTPVRAVADGIVESAGLFGEAGNMVKITHNSRYSTTYLHMSKILIGLHKGSHISRGQVIGAVGMTGLATGPHLHFGLFDNGKYVDPLKTKMDGVLDEKDLAPSQFIQASLLNLKQHLAAVTVASNGQAQDRRG